MHQAVVDIFNTISDLAIALTMTSVTLFAKLSGAVYCNRSCLWVVLWLYMFVCGSVTTDNSKLHASILTKLDL